MQAAYSAITVQTKAFNFEPTLLHSIEITLFNALEISVQIKGRTRLTKIYRHANKWHKMVINFQKYRKKTKITPDLCEMLLHSWVLFSFASLYYFCLPVTRFLERTTLFGKILYISTENAICAINSTIE